MMSSNCRIFGGNWRTKAGIFCFLFFWREFRDWCREIVEFWWEFDQAVAGNHRILARILIEYDRESPTFGGNLKHNIKNSLNFGGNFNRL